MRVDGTIEIVVGNGTRGYSGDGLDALSARLLKPSGVVVGPHGGIYIADRGNSRIRRIDTEGRITTVVGWGVERPSDVILPRPFGIIYDATDRFYVTDTGYNLVHAISAPERVLRPDLDAGFLQGDGVDEAVLRVGLDGDAEPRTVRFRMVEGEGNLSVIEGLTTGGAVSARIRSTYVGRISLLASTEGALDVTATVQVQPV